MIRKLICPVPATEPTEGQKAQMARKYGMFLHFGVNTFGNVEWSDGGIDARSYQPEKIDADGWVKTAYEAGMNYVILITKHHDGFCLWDTQYTDYCVKNSGNSTDVVAEVAKACEKYGLKLGLYYSLWDRKEASYREDFNGGYIPYMLNQLTELMDGRYGEIVELWLDGPWEKYSEQWRYDLIYDTVKRLQPGCQVGVNLTIGEPGLGDPGERYRPFNYQEGDPIRNFPSDFRLLDPYPCRKDDPKLYTHGGEVYYLPFEMTICSREGSSWFYSNIYEDKPLLDVDDTVEKVRIAFESNNMAVINVPPNTKGCLCESDVKHLMEISRKLGVARK